MNFERTFQEKHPEISWSSAQAVLKLTEEGATIPFIARYRKEQTNNLNEVAIEKILEAKAEWDKLIKRQNFIVSEIEKQGKLTPELKDKILNCFAIEALEDLYLPYKKKKQTKAAAAIEAGLLPLADWIWNCGHGTETPHPGQTLELWSLTFRNDEKGITDGEKAVAGAKDILIDRIAEITELRQAVRTHVMTHGAIKVGKGEGAKPNSKFETYFDFQEKISSLSDPRSSHRYLAIRRGVHEKELQWSIFSSQVESNWDSLFLPLFEAAAVTVPESPGAQVLKSAAHLALHAVVLPAIESEAHKSIRKVADEMAIQVFVENLRTILLSAPMGPKAVLGIDPGIRTGCKAAVVDSSGKFVESFVIRLQTDEEKAKAKALLIETVQKHQISAVAVGNGTAGRETETFIRSSLKEGNISIPVVRTNESGASIYSTSEVAREEFPDLDATIRSAISIGRRLQDPLAELVKCDPKSIGVGQYQHDVAHHAMVKSLELTVDSCVNSVGVNLNTASYHLLAHISGIGPALAKAVVEYRNQVGLFKSRSQLMEVPRFSSKAFEQAAGFIRVPESENPLDNTGVHPERYSFLSNLCEKNQKALRDLVSGNIDWLKKDESAPKEIGVFTFRDILDDLAKPGRDPRETFVPIQFRDDVFELKDLQQGMICPGVVTNVTNFGAFVDIGVHQDGLVHISQLTHRFVKDPREVVKPGDRVNVKVLEVNLEKNQISLSVKETEERPKPPPRPVQQQARPKSTYSKPQAPQKPMKPPRPKFKNDAFAALAAFKVEKK
jgi:uncharacterized protein